MQARVCARVRAELPEGARLYQEVRFPLLSIAGRENGKPETISIDFLIVRADGTWCAIDAKNPTRVSRDWRLRAAAFRAFYRAELLEVSK